MSIKVRKVTYDSIKGKTNWYVVTASLLILIPVVLFFIVMILSVFNPPALGAFLQFLFGDASS